MRLLAKPTVVNPLNRKADKMRPHPRSMFTKRKDLAISEKAIIERAITRGPTI